MRTVTEHRAAVLALVAPLPVVEVDLESAAGHVLAHEVRAPEPLPRWDNSAMDGYAVRAADLTGADDAHPVRLPVLADLAAGSAAEPSVLPGTAARIMTGAPLPPGADAVVPVEHTDGGTGHVLIRTPAAPGAHVRRAGEDVVLGDVVLEVGALLGPTQVAAAASVGRAGLEVHRRPRVAVLSTGDELVPPGRPLRHGQIPDSNSYLLAAAVADAGCDVVRHAAVPDDAATLRDLLTRLDGDVDLVLTSGGVSKGAYDVVKEVLSVEAGMEFVEVAMQPGKPQGLGRLPGGTPLVALPGNPVSVHVSFEVHVRPALLRMRGLTDLERPVVEAVAAVGWRSPAGRQQYLPAVLEDAPDDVLVRPAVAGGSGSHLVAGLARARALAVVPAEVDAVAAGDRVRVMVLDR